MRLLTYSAGQGGSPRAGVRVGHRILDIEGASRVNGEPLPSSVKALLAAGRGALARVQALAKAATTDAKPFTQVLYEERAIRFLPLVPDSDTILCIVRHETAEENPPMPAPLLLRSSGFVGHNGKSALPEGADGMDCAPAMAFVIGRQAQGVESDDAADYVAGMTLFNGFTARASKRKGGAPAGAEDGARGPCALGPDLVTLDEIANLDDLWMICTVNGEERVRANTYDLPWKMPEVLERLTRDRPLEPGDLFSIAAPAGAPGEKQGASEILVKPGDVVEFAIEGIASLRTTIAPASES